MYAYSRVQKLPKESVAAPTPAVFFPPSLLHSRTAAALFSDNLVLYLVFSQYSPQPAHLRHHFGMKMLKLASGPEPVGELTTLPQAPSHEDFLPSSIAASRLWRLQFEQLTRLVYIGTSGVDRGRGASAPGRQGWGSQNE